eukprot:5950383-Prymnesium_polylepis.1
MGHRAGRDRRLHGAVDRPRPGGGTRNTILEQQLRRGARDGLILCPPQSSLATGGQSDPGARRA